MSTAGPSVSPGVLKASHGSARHKRRMVPSVSRLPNSNVARSTTSSIPDTEALPTRSSSIWFLNVQTGRWKRQVGKSGAKKHPLTTKSASYETRTTCASTGLAVS
jgi:hypothetical protein